MMQDVFANDIEWKPGENDAEYIKALKRALERQKEVTNKAIAKIKELTKNAQQWIPVEDDLPELNEYHESDTVLCYCASGAYAFSPLVQNVFGQQWFLCEQDDECHEPVGEVIAWMPMPKYQPKEDE